MDIFLAIVSGLFITAGLIGSLIQITPGPVLAYAGLMILHFTKYADFSPAFMAITAAAALLASLSDNILTALGAKYFGGTRRAVIGAVIGIFSGIFFFPPLGMIIFALAGAVIGELSNRRKFSEALKASAGTLAGFLFSVAFKLFVSALFAYYYYLEIFLR